jgi:beta-lactamase regulating signal transducer with metallopeptidase domain
MAVLLIIAGIGLLRLRPWARWLCIGYSIVTILSTVANTVYAILVVNPAVSQSLAEFPEKMSGPKGAGAPPMPMMTPGMNTTLSIFGAIIGMTYAIVLLVVLFLPHVSAAFNQVRTTPEEEYFDSDTSR